MAEADDTHDAAAGARRAVLAAFFGNLGVAVAKLVAFLLTGSSAILAETFHSLADTGNQVFLLLGLRLGRRPADPDHPFGYGRERYFWAFIVALSIFTVGAALSVLEGVSKILHPHPIRNAGYSYGALALAFLFESNALRVAWREFGHWRRRNPGPLLRCLRQTKSPAVLVVLFEDGAALVGILVAAAGIALTQVTGNPFHDGLASLVIGVLLFVVALFVGWRTRGLLIGEAATEADRARIREAVEGVPEVESLIEVLTLHLGPEDILVNLNVHFRDGLDTDALERAVDAIEDRIRSRVPAAVRIFIEAESLRVGDAAGRSREGDPGP